MILKLTDQKIRMAFSNSAVQYEVLSGLQNEIGRELVRKIAGKTDCRHILDVGMGTGRQTNRLSLLFPEAQVTGLDFASGMIDVARQKYDSFRIVQADARRFPFKREVFDVVFSNLAYQWIDDLQRAFQDCYAILKPGGALCMTLFGRKTLDELFEAFRQESAFSLQRLPEMTNVVEAVRRAGFQEIQSDYEIIKIHFDDMLELLRWLKKIGANAVERQFYIGKNRLLKASEYYNRRCKDNWGVFAAFEVIWIKAEKIVLRDNL